MTTVDEAIVKLNTLQHRTVIKELARLVVCYIRARAAKGPVSKAACEGRARFALMAVGTSTRDVLQAALDTK